MGKDYVSLEKVRSSLHTRELHHKAFGSTCTDSPASGSVAKSGGKGRGKKNFKKFENSKGVLNLMMSVKTVRRRGIGKRNVLKRSIRRINLGLVLLLLQ